MDNGASEQPLEGRDHRPDQRLVGVGTGAGHGPQQHGQRVEQRRAVRDGFGEASTLFAGRSPAYPLLFLKSIPVIIIKTHSSETKNN